jgi:DNA-binding response OmpR family regulator
LLDTPFSAVAMSVSVKGITSSTDNPERAVVLMVDDETNRDLAVIMANARAESEDVVQVLALGAENYVTGPIDFPVLAARINAWLPSLVRQEDLRRDYRHPEYLETRDASVAQQAGVPDPEERK